MTPEQARELFEILDLIDEAHASPAADVLVLKSVVKRIINQLVLRSTRQPSV